MWRAFAVQLRRASRASACALLVVTASCSAAVERASVNVSRQATPIVIDESVKAFEEQRTRERIRDVVASPEFQELFHDLARSAAPGILEGLSEEESKERLQALTRELSTAVVEASSEAMRPLVREMVATALSSETRARVDRIAADAAASAARSAMQEAAREMPTTLAPAMHDAFAKALASPEVRAAASDGARDIAKSAVLGSRDAVNEIQAAIPGTGPIERMSLFLTKAGWVLVIFAVVFVGSLITGMWSLRRRAIRAEEASAGSARHVRKLATMMLEGGGGWSDADRQSFEAELDEEDQVERDVEDDVRPRHRRRRSPRPRA